MLRILLILGFYWIFNPTVSAALKAAQLDFTQICPEHQCRSFELRGQWGFKFGKLLEPEQILKGDIETSMQDVPGYWGKSWLNPFTSQWDKSPKEATYWMRIKNFSNHFGFGIRTYAVSTSHRILLYSMATGQKTEILNVGWNERQPFESQPYMGISYAPLNTNWEAGDYLLVFHVISPIHSRGGLRASPVIGPLIEMQKEDALEQSFYFWLIGAMLIIAIYHFLIFLQRRDDKASLWLGIQCLFIIGHTAGMQFLYEMLWSEPSALVFGWRYRLIYAAHIMGPYAFYRYLEASFPQIRSTYYRRLFLGLMVATLALLSSSVGIFTRFYLSVFALSMAVQIVWILALCIRHRRSDPDLKLILVGTIVLAIAGVSDVFSGSNIGTYLALMPYAQILFILLQGKLISKRFAHAYATAKHLSDALQVEVERQTRDIKSILNTIHQGIVTIEGQDLKFGEYRSRYLGAILPDYQGDNLKSLLDRNFKLSEDQKSQFQEALRSCLDADELNWEINQHLIPKEIIREVEGKSQVIEIECAPMLGLSGDIEKHLLCLRDVTELRELRLASEQRQEELLMLDEVLRIPEERFRYFLKRVEHFLKENEILIASWSQTKTENRLEVIRQLFMNLHTIKGSARTLQLHAIASAAHDVEQYCAAIQRQELEARSRDLMDGIDNVRTAVNQYQILSEQKLGWNADEEQIKVPLRLVLEGLQKLADVRPYINDPEQLRLMIGYEIDLERVAKVSLSDKIDEISQGMDSLARDLKKLPPNIVVSGDPVNLTQEGTQVLQAVLVHLLRNSLDHGIEDPDERRIAGKNPVGLISIHAKAEDDELVLYYRDDGRGLNLNGILQKAIAAGLADSMTPADPLVIKDLIFSPGLSTKELVTEVSGRGVGMDAVKTYIEQCGGRITVTLQQEAVTHLTGRWIPFGFQLTLPAGLWWLSTSIVALQSRSQSARPA